MKPGIKSEIKFLGYRDDAKWNHYAWLITINGVRFDYWTGVGLRRDRVKKDGDFNRKPQDRASIFCAETNAWVFIPAIDDVLECLFSDARAGAQSFYEFCDECGYERDSIKALDTYRACMDSYAKLRKALGPDYQSEQSRIEERHDS